MCLSFSEMVERRSMISLPFCERVSEEALSAFWAAFVAGKKFSKKQNLKFVKIRKL